MPKKTIRSIGLAFTGLIGIMYIASSTIMWYSFRQAEEENTRQAVARALSAFTQTQDDFSSRFADWSAWDDTYAFVENANKNYITSNLVPERLANLNVNLVLFIQPSGQIVFGTSFDLLHRKQTSIPETLRPHLSPQDLLLNHSNPHSSASGIVLLPEGPMLITSQPIVTSQGKGPIRGTLIFGRYLDANAINKLSKIACLPIKVHAFNEAQMPPDFQAVRNSLSEQEPIVVRPLSENAIAGYVLLKDIYGKPALLLRVDVPRELYKQSQNSLRYLIISLLVVGLVFGVAILLLLKRLDLFIKQYQQTESALRQAEKKYYSIFENAVEGIFQTTPDGYYISANPALARIYGYESPEELIVKLINVEQQLYVDPNLRAKFIHLMEQHDTVSGFEAQVYRRDGSTIWTSENARAVRDASGTLLCYEGSVEDITERKQTQDQLELRVEERTAELKKANEQLWGEILERQRAEEALRSSVATNRALLNAIPDLMFRISADGTFVNYKAAKEDNLLLPPSEFLGKKISSVLPPQITRSTMYCVEQALLTGEVQIFEYQLLLNNSLHDYEARIVVSAENEVMAIVRDITQRKQAEADIRNALEKEKELSELKSRFVSMTSHEFRTPLTTILSSAELLQDYGAKWPEEKKLKHLQRIQTVVKHMTQLLNDVLLIGKAEAGKLQCNPVSLDVSAFCRDLVDELQTSITTHTIAFCSQGQCSNAYIDEKLLRHILSNLLSNAIKYSPHGGTVHFDLICEQDQAIFHIQDRGIGIPLADQAQLFDSFHRASNVGTISGTGLGLAIVKKSVDVHGGNITVKSAVGVGTTFTVNLPLNRQG